jgi:hypothetical protein
MLSPVVLRDNDVMCERCAELDQRIARYREVAELILDQPALSSIRLLIERCEAQKRELHSEREAALLSMTFR